MVLEVHSPGSVGPIGLAVIGGVLAGRVSKQHRHHLAREGMHVCLEFDVSSYKVTLTPS